MLTEVDVAAAHEKAKDFAVVVTGSVVVRDGKILLCRRSLDDDFLPGYWELPGGRVDPGESLWDGMHRELKEETGLAIDVIFEELPAMDYHNKNNESVRQCTFLVSCAGELVLSNEHVDFRWIRDGNELATLELSEKQLKLVEAALAAVERMKA